MTGPIAAILAIMIGAASSIGNVDCGAIIDEAVRIEEEQKAMEEASKYVIAIDAGHQGQGNFGQEPVGPGASEMKTKVAGGTRGTTTGVPEYELTLDISLQLRDELLERGYQVIMIRETHDVDIPNSERAKIANDAEADAFIRVHANGSNSASANGAMTICQTSSNPYNSELYEESKRLSELVLDAYTEATGIRKEYVWETDTMSGINWCEVPVTIIELGYMTNPEEDRKMQDDDFQELMVQGMADGIEAYINEKKEAGAEETEAEEAVTAPEEQEKADTASTASTASTKTAAVTEPEDEFEYLDEEDTEEPGEGGTGGLDKDEFEFLDEEDPEEEARQKEKERLEEENRAREARDQELRDVLSSTIFTPARKTERSAKEIAEIIEAVGDSVINQHKMEIYSQSQTQMKELEEQLVSEIGKLGGNWSLYLKRLDTDQVIGINEDKKMVAASLIKLFVAGEFYTMCEQGQLDADDYFDLPDVMISISDNGAANSLINAVTMLKVNEFAKKNGYEETELNRKMLEWNGTENYTSARDCGRMLEEVVKGKYVSKKASERILNALKEQQRRGKIPAGVPEGIQTGNKTGELDNVDNDAAIVWSPECTYILCIMSSDTGGRVPEIVKLSSMVYDSINASQD